MKKLITIIGPTACGKTSLATSLAAKIKANIISGDSRQVYKFMNIGTGKDLSDYNLPSGESIPYYLIDIVLPGTKYNVYQYQNDFLNVYSKLIREDNPIILCGGSGLYIEAVLKGYDLSTVPQNEELRKYLKTKSLTELANTLKDLKTQNNSSLHNHTDIDTVNRAIRAIEIETYKIVHTADNRIMPKIDSLIIGIAIDRETRRNLISKRLKDRMQEGMIDEVRMLLKMDIKPEDLIYYGLEYKYITLYLINQITYNEMYKQLEIAIHQFAKRQMTWFRGMERRGFTINWIDYNLPMQEKISQIQALLYK